MWGAGHLVNINDISGPFSGILFGISNTIATVPGFVAPALVGIITKNVRFNFCYSFWFSYLLSCH